MANVKELKKRIKTTKSTLKITSAMKLVSAAKLAKAQQAITSSRPYSRELEKTIKTVAALVSDYEHIYLKPNDAKKDLLLVISSNKGLCGGYNAQLAREVRLFVSKSENKIETYFIGKKVKELVSKDVNQIKKFDFEKLDPTHSELSVVAKELAAHFEKKEIGSIFVAFNFFHSALNFTPTIKQVLPFSLSKEELADVKHEVPYDFKYNPKPAEILDGLIPQAYINSIFTCLLDALAAEHGSRMAAMDSATSNCKDAIKSLTLEMNKLRQAAITTELIEVVSGAESLKG